MGRGLFRFNTGMPTLAPTGPQFELSNERNKPSWRLGVEVLLKSLRFSPSGPPAAAPNKRGFVGSTVGALVKLVGQVLLCWVSGGTVPSATDWLYVCVCVCAAHADRDALLLRRG